jgi:type I site-specific restriction endonuclease
VTLNIPFVFSSNGDGFIFHDRTGTSMEKEATLSLDAFPSPKDLWSRYRAWKGLTPDEEAIVLQDYFEDGSGKEPRYYQRNAINASERNGTRVFDIVLHHCPLWAVVPTRFISQNEIAHCCGCTDT